MAHSRPYSSSNYPLSQRKNYSTSRHQAPPQGQTPTRSNGPSRQPTGSTTEEDSSPVRLTPIRRNEKEKEEELRSATARFIMMFLFLSVISVVWTAAIPTRKMKTTVLRLGTPSAIQSLCLSDHSPLVCRHKRACIPTGTTTEDSSPKRSPVKAAKKKAKPGRLQMLVIVLVSQHQLTTSSYSSDNEYEQFLKGQGRIAGRVVHLFHWYPSVLSEGIARDPDDDEDMYNSM